MKLSQTLFFSFQLLRKTYEECNPCGYHYDAIIKMETFSEDVSHILQTVGAGWIAPAHNNNRGSHKKYNMEEIFANSSSEDIRGIVERFNMDFRICGYDDTLETLRKISEMKA